MVVPMFLRQGLPWEFVGTVWRGLGGCGSAVLAAAVPAPGIGFAGVALAFGFTVVTMAYAVGHISGAHFNPAVTAGLCAAGRFSTSELLPYWLAPVAGALVPAPVLFQIAPASFWDRVFSLCLDS